MGVLIKVPFVLHSYWKLFPNIPQQTFRFSEKARNDNLKLRRTRANAELWFRNRNEKSIYLINCFKSSVLCAWVNHFSLSPHLLPDPEYRVTKQIPTNRKPNRKHIKYAMRTELLQIVMLLLLFCRKYQKSTAFIPVDDYL